MVVGVIRVVIVIVQYRGFQEDPTKRVNRLVLAKHGEIAILFPTYHSQKARSIQA
jgi:hypothetical protein